MGWLVNPSYLLGVSVCMFAMGERRPRRRRRGEDGGVKIREVEMNH